MPCEQKLFFFLVEFLSSLDFFNTVKLTKTFGYRDYLLLRYFIAVNTNISKHVIFKNLTVAFVV